MSVSDTEEREVHALRIQIDRGICVGFGDCVTEAPGAFALDEEGLVVFVDPQTADREGLLFACAACPVDAILVWDLEGQPLVP